MFLSTGGEEPVLKFVILRESHWGTLSGFFSRVGTRRMIILYCKLIGAWLVMDIDNISIPDRLCKYQKIYSDLYHT